MLNRMSKRIRFSSSAMVMAGGLVFEADTEDLSLTGLFIRTNHHLPVGHQAAITLKIPSMSRGPTLDMEGVVVRNSVRGFGVRFKALDHETVAHLRTVINNRKPAYASEIIARQRESHELSRSRISLAMTA